MVILTVLKILSSVIAILLSVAFFTLVERKMLGSIHRRRGPNVVGFQGLMQAFADGLKLFVKETILPSSANKTLFILAPIITFTLCLMGWNVIPFGEGLVIADLNVGVLFILAISSLGVYGIIISGWSSNSKYAFLGGLRAAAQMVSYEVSIGFIIITVVLCAGSFNLTSIVLAQEKVWFFCPTFPHVLCINAEYMGMVILTVLKILSSVIAILLSVAFFTLVERKMLGSIHRRRGPNVVGFQGLMQAFADGLKLFVKETILPSSANKTLFILAPIITFTLCLMGWNVIPFGEGLVIADLNVGVLFILAISSLGVYGIIISGWSSNSKYAFLGGLRAAAQMVSYEVSIGFIIITVVLCAGSFNLTSIVLAQEKVWFFVPHFPMFILFFVSALAETARIPFDLTEAESELVSGYNVEYSAVGFVLFFLGEYANILLMSALTTVLFLGGWLPPFNFFPFTNVPGPIWFALKIAFFVMLFILMRACLPRFRYDQLMALGWKVFLPFSLGWLLLTSSILISFNWLPN